MIDATTQKRLRELYNPDGSDLRTMQLELLGLLVEFDRICRKHDIDYWLDSGTLIGAARHGGFIPWDDDIDVCILKKDRKKLLDAMEQELSSPYYYTDANTTSHHARRYARLESNRISIEREVPKPRYPGQTDIRKENIWLDVFFEINGTPAVSRTVNRFFGPIFRRRYKLIEDGWAKYALSVILYPIAILSVWSATIYGRLFHPNSLIHEFGTGFHSQRMIDDIFPIGHIMFESQDFYAPRNVDSYLKRIYGNWMELPGKIESHNITRITVNDIPGKK